VLGSLRWLVQATEEEVQWQLSGMKSAYSQMSVGSSISSEIFNFWMVLLVKLAAYFLSNHVAAVLVDSALECDIYRHTMLHLLGTALLTKVPRPLPRHTHREEHLPHPAADVQLQAISQQGEAKHQPGRAGRRAIEGRRKGKRGQTSHHPVDWPPEW
jgi:hypothetical protein